jgi:hypothetical protein
MASSFGKMPTTSVRRLTSPLSRSSELADSPICGKAIILLSSNTQIVWKFCSPQRDLVWWQWKFELPMDGMDLRNRSGPQERFRAYTADLASVLAVPTGSDRSRITVSDCFRPKAARASNRWPRPPRWNELRRNISRRYTLSLRRPGPSGATDPRARASVAVDVVRQYCGQLGKPDNCQVAGRSVGGHPSGKPAHRLSALESAAAITTPHAEFIATLCIRLARTLVLVLQRCLCCGNLRQTAVEQNK